MFKVSYNSDSLTFICTVNVLPLWDFVQEGIFNPHNELHK